MNSDKTILIADEDMIALKPEIAEMSLRGWTVRHFPDADSAYAVVQSGEKFSCYLLDVMLAAGITSTRFSREQTDDYMITGLILAQRIRELDHETPIFFFTQASSKKLKERIERICMEIPHCGVLFKHSYDDPISLADDLDALLSGKREPARENRFLRALGRSILLQPNVAGIGIDLKELGRGLQKQKKKSQPPAN